VEKWYCRINEDTEEAFIKLIAWENLYRILIPDLSSKNNFPRTLVRVSLCPPTLYPAPKFLSKKNKTCKQ